MTPSDETTQAIFESLADQVSGIAGLRSSILDDVNFTAGFGDVARPAFEALAEQMSSIAGLQSSVLSSASFVSEIHETLTQPVFECLAEAMLTHVAGLRSSILDDVNFTAGFGDVARPAFEALAEQIALLREAVVPDLDAAAASPTGATLTLARVRRHQLLAWAAYPMTRACVFCLVTYLYLALWSTHPELAAMISGPLWLAVGMLLVYLGNQQR